MLKTLYFLASVICCDVAFLQPTGGNCLVNRARLGLFLFYKYCIYFIIELDTFICFEVSDASSGGLEYTRRDTLDVNML